MIRYSFLGLAAVACLLTTPMHANELIAIDALLQPDDVMLEQASGWNARMREQSPDGFELDDQHAPHITLVSILSP